MEISDEMLNNLRCAKCQEYLIYFPIYTLQDDYTTVCGNCYLYSQKAIRNYEFEVAAKHFKFPCANAENGCEVRLTPELLVKHQDEFCMRRLQCPFKHKNEPCSWKDYLFKFLEHAQTQHTCNLIDIDYVFAFNPEFCNKDVEYLLQCMNHIFLITLNFNGEHSGSISVRILTKTDVPFKYQIKSDDTTMDELDVVNMFGETVCRIFYINSNQFQLLLRNENDTKQPTLEDLNTKLLKFFQCQICGKNKHAKIKECNNHCGKLLCAKCAKANHHTCHPDCRPSIKNRFTVRHQVTEAIANMLFYPCKNPGCTVTDRYENIIKHEKECQLKLYECPIVSCDVSGMLFDDLCNHVHNHITEHQVNILTENSFELPESDSAKETVYVILKHECIFLFKCKYNDSLRMNIVELYAPLTTEEKFRMRFEINNEEKNFYIFGDVPSYNCDYKFDKDSLHIPEVVLRPLVNEQSSLSCNIDIIKN